MTRVAGTRALFGLALVCGAAPARAADEPERHLFYLHGRIVQEEQSARPIHPLFGPYELEAICEAFRAHRFVVHGEIRPKLASVDEAADRVVEQVRQLLESGVGADRITVVGASAGGAIALVASSRLRNPDLRFAILGACLSESMRGLLADEQKRPSGRFLFIREESDDQVGPCPSWKDDLHSSASLIVREIVLQTGLSHGFLYRPMAEWVNPVVEWAEATKAQRESEPSLAAGGREAAVARHSDRP